MPAQPQAELVGVAAVQAQLLLPNQTSPTNLDDLLVFKEASFKENVFSGEATYTLTYATTSLQFVEQVLNACELTGTPLIRFRYGYGSPERTQWMPWQNGIVIQATSMPINLGNQAGHNVVLTIGNSLFLAARNTKTTVYKGLISDMVAQIADIYKLSSVIEPTQNQFAYIQSYESDISFIAQRLQPRASNSNGRGNYLFYVRDNVLHFHTPDYQASYSQLSYYESPHMHMGQNSLGQLLFAQGVGGTRLIAHDPYTATTRELSSDPAKALKLSDTLPQLNTASSHNIFYHLGENRPEESVNIGQNVYERARMETYKVTLSLQKIISIRAGDFLNLIVTATTSQTSTWSGVYLVMETVYMIKAGLVASAVTLTRGETTATTAQITTQDSNSQLVAETAAPGHALNLRDLQDSEKSKGANQQGANSLFATVSDPNSAPV